MTDFFGNDYFGEYFSDGYFGPTAATNPGSMSASLSGSGDTTAELTALRRAAGGDGSSRKQSSARAIHSSQLPQYQETATVLEYRQKPKVEPVQIAPIDDDEEAIMLLLSA